VILLLDTSSSQLLIGLASDEGMLLREFHAEPSAEGGERGIHDARLAIETANLFHAESASVKDIARIGLIIGPGSFTGLRIGLSFAKGLAFATGAGIVPMTAHEVLQAGNPSHNGYIITLGYRQDLFYVAESDSPREIRLASGSELSNLPEKPILAHDFFALHPSSFFPPPLSFALISLAAMARIAATSLKMVIGSGLDGLEPLYLTEFNVAEGSQQGANIKSSNRAK
jgi:tRNA threonylcarbamoyl adenosine modification protein YeaZ